MNLPDIYARVCAVRPELAVEGLRRLAGYWYRGSMCELEPIAAALILARWVEALPVDHWISHSDKVVGLPDGWRVGYRTATGIEIAPLRWTPIESLAAFYLGEKA